MFLRPKLAWLVDRWREARLPREWVKLSLLER
jgi:hypothetical protein